MKSKSILRYLIEIAWLALIYHLAARLGLQMAYVQQNTSPVWPPSGIALAALLLLGIRDWPGITLAWWSGRCSPGRHLAWRWGWARPIPWKRSSAFLYSSDGSN